jgi:hypothetical protein
MGGDESAVQATRITAVCSLSSIDAPAAGIEEDMRWL